jgi:hypothetical protein
LEGGRLVQAAFHVDGLLHAILTCVTAGPGLGFNRAMLFLPSADGHELMAAMAIGPASPEEAQATWARLVSEQHTLDEPLHRQGAGGGKSGLSALVEGLSIPLVPPTTKPRGTGLGLAVVRKIVDDHRGSIEVRSSEHEGTTLAVVLPVRRSPS